MELDTALGLIAGVLVMSALAAGLVERAPLSFPMLFPGLGFREPTSARTALQLWRLGVQSEALQGGLNAWRSRDPIESTADAAA